MPQLPFHQAPALLPAWKIQEAAPDRQRRRLGTTTPKKRTGISGGRTFPNANGAPCARIIPPGGTAWDYFPHDHARSRAYRWGEDGIAGVSDDKQRLCLSLALWNGKDPILKERLFGLTNAQGNHGEDVKEIYYYLDATPTQSYLKMLYKYPQQEFPYAQLLEVNRTSGQDAPEFELLDTGIFGDDRYFDVFIEYAKASPTDLLMRVTVHNRGPEAAVIHVLPQLWFRNTWSWKLDSVRPDISRTNHGVVTRARGNRRLRFLFRRQTESFILRQRHERPPPLRPKTMATGYFKDAFHEYVVHGNQAAVNPQCSGTKVGVWHQLTVRAGGSAQIRLRLAQPANGNPAKPFSDFDAVFAQRIQEADDFYAHLAARHGLPPTNETSSARRSPG